MKNIALLFVTLLTLSSCGEKRKYLFYGDDGYTEYRIISDDNDPEKGALVLNNGLKPFYISITARVKPKSYSNRSWFYKTFIYTNFQDSIVYEEVKLDPNDSIRVKYPKMVNDQWKYIDECGHKIPLAYIFYVGYFDKDNIFHKK